ncbi:MAG: phosphotransferase [Armatimonadota bacterium]|nr:phosphotransferase [Armatimonadota bacterium]
MNALIETSLLKWATGIIPKEISSVIQVDSNEINAVFRLTCPDEGYFLKTGPDLQREYRRLKWLAGRISAPLPIAFRTFETKDAFLMSAIDGENLAQLKASLTPQIIITRLAAALKTIHATDTSDWPFERKEGGVLVHGDACLPNFMYRGDHLRGCIDVGDMSLDSPEIDLAAAVWSLQYNLGPGHGLPFLREYGVPNATEEDVERLRLLYE